MLLGGVIVICSLVFPGLAMYRERSRLALARSDLLMILEAGERFFDEYRKWPSANTGDFGDCRYGEEVSNRDVFNVLRGIDGPGNVDHGANPHRLSFIEIEGVGLRGSGLDSGGVFLDPWGVQYQLVIDTDFDNACDVEGSAYLRVVGEGMIVWSYGPDGRPDTPDDLLSWQDR